jgi:hypothetical protein
VCTIRKPSASICRETGFFCTARRNRDHPERARCFKLFPTYYQRVTFRNYAGSAGCGSARGQVEGSTDQTGAPLAMARVCLGLDVPPAIRGTTVASYQQVLQEHVVFVIERKDSAATTASLTEVALKSVRRSTRSKRIAAMSDDELRELLTTFVERTLKRAKS